MDYGVTDSAGDSVHLNFIIRIRVTVPTPDSCYGWDDVHGPLGLTGDMLERIEDHTTPSLLTGVDFIETKPFEFSVGLSDADIYQARYREGNSVDIAVKAEDFTAQAEVLRVVSEVATDYGTMPAAFRQGLHHIELVGCYSPNPDGQPACQRSGTYLQIPGPDNQDLDMVSLTVFTPYYIVQEGTLLHELVHHFDFNFAFNWAVDVEQPPNGKVSGSLQWEAAAAADGAFVTQYAEWAYRERDGGALHEDFAETVMYWLYWRYRPVAATKSPCPGYGERLEAVIGNRMRVLDDIDLTGRMCPLVPTDCR